MTQQIKIGETYLTIKNYKEPLKEIKKKDGFGFYGTLLATNDGQYIQCHVCGQLYQNLSRHVLNAHKKRFSSIKEYREHYELARSTALISETERIRLKKATLRWLATLTPKQLEERKRKMRDVFRRRGNYQPPIALETKNKRGTCPDQLLAKIKEVADRLKKTPTLGQFIHETGTQRYKFLIFKTFGSWNNALKMLKLPLNETKSHKGARHRRHTDEELLEYLRIFTQENQMKPTATDCKRGLLPGYEVYERHFGTFEEARQQAGVYEILK